MNLHLCRSAYTDHHAGGFIFPHELRVRFNKLSYQFVQALAQDDARVLEQDFQRLRGRAAFVHAIARLGLHRLERLDLLFQSSELGGGDAVVGEVGQFLRGERVQRPATRDDLIFLAHHDGLGGIIHAGFQRQIAHLHRIRMDGARGATPDVVASTSVLKIWQQREASDAEFARLSVAAWRAVGIPARLGAAGGAEFWTGTEWKEISRPLAADKASR